MEEGLSEWDGCGGHSAGWGLETGVLGQWAVRGESRAQVYLQAFLVDMKDMDMGTGGSGPRLLRAEPEPPEVQATLQRWGQGAEMGSGNQGLSLGHI